jgi:hypothetical protein
VEYPQIGIDDDLEGCCTGPAQQWSKLTHKAARANIGLRLLDNCIPVSTCDSGDHLKLSRLYQVHRVPGISLSKDNRSLRVSLPFETSRDGLQAFVWQISKKRDGT